MDMDKHWKNRKTIPAEKKEGEKKKRTNRKEKNETKNYEITRGGSNKEIRRKKEK